MILLLNNFSDYFSQRHFMQMPKRMKMFSGQDNKSMLRRQSFFFNLSLFLTHVNLKEHIHKESVQLFSLDNLQMYQVIKKSVIFLYYFIYCCSKALSTLLVFTSIEQCRKDRKDRKEPLWSTDKGGRLSQNCSLFFFFG